MAHLLVIRFSSLGDVAMTVPVVASFARNYPQHTLTVVSREAFAPLFEGLPQQIRFYGVDLRQAKGITGLFGLFGRLRALRVDAVVDLHGVLRTHALRSFFRLTGTAGATINKQRTARRRLVRQSHKQLTPLRSSIEAYTDVFARLGYAFSVGTNAPYEPAAFAATPPFGHAKGSSRWVGVAPFAKHKGKVYPTERMTQVITRLAAHANLRLFIFGGGAEERRIAAAWETQLPQSVVSLVGKGTLHTELAQMRLLDVMVSMDSSNMHLASLVRTPVVSVWGATHPFAGFMGWGQSIENAAQTELPCRPCSVFGNKPCRRGDYACLNRLAPGRIVELTLNCLEKATDEHK